MRTQLSARRLSRRPLATAGLLLLAAVAMGCETEELGACTEPVGTSATCEDACRNLFGIGCRLGQDENACVAICQTATARPDEAQMNRVRACYAHAGTCAAVDTCSQRCGPGDAAVVFNAFDAGTWWDSGPGPDGSTDSATTD